MIEDERIMPFSEKNDYAAAYVPLEQSPSPVVGVIVQTALDPRGAEAAVRHTVSTVNKDQPLTSLTTVEQLKLDSMASDGVRVTLLSTFATVSLFLAAIGLCGVVS